MSCETKAGHVTELDTERGTITVSIHMALEHCIPEAIENGNGTAEQASGVSPANVSTEMAWASQPLVAS